MAELRSVSGGVVPQWTLGWRMRRALEHGGIGVQQIAEHLGVHRSTVNRWMHDSGDDPKPPFLREWAVITGVSAAWLIDGIGDDPDGPPPVNSECSWSVKVTG